MAPELNLLRTFNVPKQTVFNAWGNHDRLQQWWQPPGMTLRILALDFKPAGEFHYLLESPDGFRIYGLWKFMEIVPPDKLIFINAYANEHGKIVQASFSETWPREIFNELHFIEKNGRTLMKLRARPFKADSLESATFAENVENIRFGLNTTFDRLGECIYG